MEQNQEYDAMIIIVIRNLIKEVESQGKTFVTIDALKEFIHNLETNTPIFGKKYVSENHYW